VTPARTRRAAAVVLVLAALVAACGDDAPSLPSQPAGRTFPSGDIRIGYTLDLPSGSGPFPAIVFGHGSGRSTRDEARGLGGRMVSAGFAVLRYDKRGVGESGGVYEGVGPINGERVLSLLADDMAAGVAFLGTRPEIDSRRIGLMGVSQAGWVIPLAARRAPSAAFMVLVVGPTVSVGLEIFYSDLAERTAVPLEQVYPQLTEFRGPAGFDPRPTLEAISTPGLWLLGEQDRSIPTPHTVAVLAELRAAGRPYRWIVYPGAGHGMTDAATGAPVDYLSDVIEFLAPWRR
jgi:pimeloyl-ACP methyl ester carboxylesterase